MEHLAADALRGAESYRLLIDTICPRPIAWVGSVSASGVRNLAPFSFFNGVSSRPPIVSVAIAAKVERDEEGLRVARDKDTLANIRATEHFVIHPAPAALWREVHQCGKAYPADIDEAAACGLEWVEASWGPAPRLANAPVALECRLHRLIEVGSEPQTTLVLGEVLGWHIAEGLRDASGRIPSTSWAPLARLGVDGYARLGERMDPT